MEQPRSLKLKFDIEEEEEDSLSTKNCDHERISYKETIH